MADLAQRLAGVDPLRFDSCQQYLLALGFCFDPVAQVFVHEDKAIGDIPAGVLDKLSPPHVLARYISLHMS